MAGFLNDDFGITAGMFGEVHITKNGGIDWPKIPEVNDKYAIDALASGQFIHAGFAGKVGMISDGITSKSFESPVSGHVMLVNFFDEQTGCAVNKINDIKITTDAGKTWHNIEKHQSIGTIIAIDLFSKNGISVLDNTGSLFITNDRGINWSNTLLSVQKYNIDFTGLKPNSALMRFSDDDNGIIAIIVPAKVLKNSSVMIIKYSDDAINLTAVKIRCRLNTGSKIFLSPDTSFLTVSGDNEIILFKHI